MANREQRSRPRLYLVTGPLSDPTPITDELTAAVTAADVAAVLIQLAPADERTQVNRLKALAPGIQAKGVAVLIDGDPALVARAGADGAHLVGTEALRDALPRLKPERIAGAGALHSRHDAMLAAEIGADYVMFGEPDSAGHRPSFTAIIERVAWWSELFEIPCVAWAERIDEVAELCAAGADFVAVGSAVLSDPRGVTAAVAEAGMRLAAGRTA
jgi:thiamine-phosphate pyrophosphorylase